MCVASGQGQDFFFPVDVELPLHQVLEACPFLHEDAWHLHCTNITHICIDLFLDLVF